MTEQDMLDTLEMHGVPALYPTIRQYARERFGTKDDRKPTVSQKRLLHRMVTEGWEIRSIWWGYDPVLIRGEEEEKMFDLHSKVRGLMRKGFIEIHHTEGQGDSEVNYYRVTEDGRDAIYL